MLQIFSLLLTLLSASFFFVPDSFAQKNEKFLPAEYYKIKKGDSFYKIAKKYDVGIDEVMIANPDLVNPEKLKTGKVLTLPTTHLVPNVKREGIVINLAEMRLYLFVNDDQILTFPISIGAYEKTPLGKTKIAGKRENPTWTPSESIKLENPSLPDIVPPGPNNPLGKYALYLDGSKQKKWTRIMIHGTNASWTIGSAVSHGCIRMYPRDIKIIFDKVNVATPVRIVSHQLKIAEIDDKIYLESHLKQLPEESSKTSWVNQYLCKKVKDCQMRIDWNKVDEAMTQNRGVPVDVSLEIAAENIKREKNS